jgi:hypothetical protein
MNRKVTTPFMVSGKLMDSKYHNEVSTKEQQMALLRATARGETVSVPVDPATYKDRLKRFTPILKHPLPLSERRSTQEALLRRILSMRVEKQVQAAATLGSAWVIEELYMRGAPIDLQDRNGFQPIHLACQTNNFEALMVLLNIGVDINAVTHSGLTPLFLATASNASEVKKLLQEQGAKMRMEPKATAPGSTILDLHLQSSESTITVKSSYVGMPSDHLLG